MKRCAVFAHFDKKNVIENYVVYYLQELKKSFQTIIFVSDCNLDEKELEKIKEFANHTIAKRHGEYDFGSYKRGYLYLKENNVLENYDELFFINDSCFGPIGPIEKLLCGFKDCDFWGIHKNDIEVKCHVQSFFEGFKKNVFTSEIFNAFISSIKKEDEKNDIIKKYEIGLSEILTENGFCFETVFEEPIERKITREMFSYSNPLIKTIALKGHSFFFIKIIFSLFLKNGNYPLDLILNYAKTNNEKFFNIKDLKCLFKLIFRLQLKRRRLYFLNKWYKF